jgi:hypothetical protein
VLWAGHPAHTMTTGGLLGLGEHPSRIYAPVSLVPSSKKKYNNNVAKRRKGKNRHILASTHKPYHTYIFVQHRC